MPQGDDSPSTPPQLLFIEDALDLASVVIRELDAAGYHIAHTNDGKTGVQRASEQDFQLVILDGMLPRIDSLDA